MLTVDEAREVVRARARAVPGTERVPLASALLRVLAEPVRAARPDPPFDRAAMDGYAVRARDTAAPPRVLRVVGRVAAGARDLPEIGPGEAAWINTGAPLPPGADAVVPVEETRGEAEVLAAVEPGACVLRRGTLARPGDVVADGLLTAERVAICAAVGAAEVLVRRRPRVAILSTGSELSDEPAAHEIRNSNGPMLRALLAGAEVIDLGVAADEAAELDRALARGLADADVLVTTGGVSKGEHDLVRPRLEAMGAEVHVHGVALQPGKPFLFATRGETAAFGLPGNPVSALVCADLFVLPFVAVRAGRSFDEPLIRRRARLLAPAAASPKRRRVFPCRLRGDDAEPLPWRGSADLYTLARANAYVVVEVGRSAAAGAEVTCLVPERSAARTLLA